MPRKRELTWQPGSGNRQGRWRKKYRGRSIYLCSAPCKSDLDGYQRALTTWRKKKVEIDAEDAAKPKPHQRQYQEVIAEWEHVLRWTVEHDDDRHAVLASDSAEPVGSKKYMQYMYVPWTSLATSGSATESTHHFWLRSGHGPLWVPKRAFASEAELIAFRQLTAGKLGERCRFLSQFPMSDS